MSNSADELIWSPLSYWLYGDVSETLPSW